MGQADNQLWTSWAFGSQLDKCRWISLAFCKAFAVFRWSPSGMSVRFFDMPVEKILLSFAGELKLQRTCRRELMASANGCERALLFRQID
jgi:hypothetical protein